jgi:hypothetical protein
VAHPEGEGVELDGVEEVTGAVQLDDHHLVDRPLGLPDRSGDEVGLDSVEPAGDLQDVDGPATARLGRRLGGRRGGRGRSDEGQEGAEDQEEA